VSTWDQELRSTVRAMMRQARRRIIGFGPSRWDAMRHGRIREALHYRHDVVITTFPDGAPNGWHCTGCTWATDELF
jgi:hypothetical protein